jgi:hypothetical protein
MASSDQTHPPEGLGTDIEAIRQEARAIFERASRRSNGMKKAACGEREILHPAASTQLVR